MCKPYSRRSKYIALLYAFLLVSLYFITKEIRLDWIFMFVYAYVLESAFKLDCVIQTHRLCPSLGFNWGCGFWGKCVSKSLWPFIQFVRDWLRKRQRLKKEPILFVWDILESAMRPIRRHRTIRAKYANVNKCKLKQ